MSSTHECIRVHIVTWCHVYITNHACQRTQLHPRRHTTTSTTHGHTRKSTPDTSTGPMSPLSHYPIPRLPHHHPGITKTDPFFLCGKCFFFLTVQLLILTKCITVYLGFHHRDNVKTKTHHLDGSPRHHHVSNDQREGQQQGKWDRASVDREEMAVTMRKGPNDAGRVVWALGKFFFYYSLHLTTNYYK